MASKKMVGERNQMLGGRELSHGQLGMNVLQRVAEQVQDVAKVEAYPRMEGRQMLMVLAPK